jgi:predicted ATPase
LKRAYPISYKSVVDTIQLVAPFFYDFVTDKDDEYLQLEWYHVNQKDKELKAHLLSDGTLRFICLATLLMQPEELMPDTIFIDEPELGLHPYAISVLADLLKRVSITKQIIVSTQSVELINHLAQEDIIVVNQNNGLSTFERLSTEDLKDWLEIYNTIGDIWKSNIIGGRP